jgi:hypothetical protein
MSYMFNACSSLISIPRLDMSSALNINNMFYGCVSLATTPELNTSSATTMNGAFQNCYSHVSIPKLDTSSVTGMVSAFTGCNSLAKLELNPDVTGWAGVAIVLTQCSLSRKALVSFFNSLPTVTTQRNISLTGNPGVGDLTDDDKLIATDKNWTLAL